MNVFLVYGSLRIGGIETLIVRIANFLASKDVRVTVFCTEGGELGSLLNHGVNLIGYSETSDLVRSANAHLHDMGTGSSVLILSFDPISAGRALLVETALPKKIQVTHASGIFHPRAYFMTGERKDRIFLNHLVARAIGKGRLFFMNLECKESHARRWKTDLSHSPILALPINVVESRWQPTTKTNVRIVSVGRLVDFKTYNMGAGKVVRECLDRGVEITWDIYGDGPLQNFIKNEIETLGLAGNVRLMGALQYSDFAAKVADYDLFVGMGTAALEAAIVGVPTICATVDQATRCYGYLHDLPYGNVGETQASPPTLELADLVHGYSKMGQSERTQLSKQSHAAAEKYSIPKFVEALTDMAESAESHATPSRIAKRFIGELYRFATESAAVKAIRRHARARA